MKCNANTCPNYIPNLCRVRLSFITGETTKPRNSNLKKNNKPFFARSVPPQLSYLKNKPRKSKCNHISFHYLQTKPRALHGSKERLQTSEVSLSLAGVYARGLGNYPRRDFKPRKCETNCDLRGLVV